VADGGNAIPYHMEGPYVREMFESKLAEIGADATMPPIVYTPEGQQLEFMTE
jgi:hypothetical protein